MRRRQRLPLMFKTLKIIRKQKKGFTILEVIIAALIFALTVAGLLTAVALTRKPAAMTTRELMALAKARNIIDYAGSKVDAATYDTGFLTPGDYFRVDGDYLVEWEITNTEEGRNIYVTVSWNEQN